MKNMYYSFKQMACMCLQKIFFFFFCIILIETPTTSELLPYNDDTTCQAHSCDLALHLLVAL